MGIWDSIKQFGSNVVSSIGSVISSSPTTYTGIGGDVTFVGPPAPSTSITSNIGNTIGGLYNSAISRISSWINPPPTVVATPSAPKTVYIWGGSAPLAPSATTAPSVATAPSPITGNNNSLFGLPQGVGLVLVAVGVGYLIFNKGKI